MVPGILRSVFMTRYVIGGLGQAASLLERVAGYERAAAYEVAEGEP